MAFMTSFIWFTYQISIISKSFIQYLSLNQYYFCLKGGNKMDSRETTEFIKSEVVSTSVAYEGKWLGMRLVSYSIGERVTPNYECIYRTTKKSNCRTDGVEIIPIIKYKNKPSQLVMIANYRPPVQSFCLQLPSGLVENEDYEQNVRRQLLQQTGYVVSKLIDFPLPTLYIDPWKSNESTIMYIGIIDGDDPKHKQKQTLEAEENIRVITVEVDGKLPQRINQLAEKDNYLIEGKLWSVCTGLVLSAVLN